MNSIGEISLQVQEKLDRISLNDPTETGFVMGAFGFDFEKDYAIALGTALQSTHVESISLNVKGVMSIEACSTLEVFFLATSPSLSLIYF
jgi:hypothetical protein